MKNKILVLAVVVIILSASFLIYNKYQYKERSIIEITNIKKSDITKIVLIGNFLDNKITYEDKNDIDKIFKLIEGDIVKGDFNEYSINNLLAK